MFYQLITRLPLDNPPPDDSIMWMRSLEAKRYKANLTTIWNGEEYRFYEYEVIPMEERDMQQAVAGITHEMTPADAEMNVVVETFRSPDSGLWLIYSEAIQAGSTVVDALKRAFDLDGEVQFDRFFWFKRKAK